MHDIDTTILRPHILKIHENHAAVEMMLTC